MDIVMPEVDGIEALKKIKEINPAVRVVMLSAMGTPGMLIEALLKGALDFIVKPFQAERLIGTVKKSLNNDRMYNGGFLKQLQKEFGNSINILTQDVIDEIIKAASQDGVSNNEFNEFNYEFDELKEKIANALHAGQNGSGFTEYKILY